jgi:hypothetical protein
MSIVAPRWSGAQKFQFTNANNTYTCQINPNVYTAAPQTPAAPQVPAAMGPTYLSGAVEMPPTGIVLVWDEFSYPDYLTLAQFHHLQPTTMIDMQDNAFYGWLQLGAFEYEPGAMLEVGKVQAVFNACTPANGVHSVINTLSTPSAPTYSVSTGGSIASGTSAYYCISQWSRWGETQVSPVISVSTGGTNNAAISLNWSSPTSAQFRRTRIYTAPTAAGLAAGATATVLADIWAGFTQSWIDTCNLSGNTRTATIPTANTAYLGAFYGARWINKP